MGFAGACFALLPLACGNGAGAATGDASTSDGGVGRDSGGGLGDATTGDGSPKGDAAMGADTSAPPKDASESGTGPGDGGFPAGWLYTSGAKIMVSDGSGGKPWMGRGVNVDDIFLCGYDNTLWMSSPETTLETILSGLISGWGPNFIRISLGMDSDPTVVSWLTNPSQYKTPMTNVINAIGKNPNVYVLVTLRSDASMIGQDETDGDPEATGLPSDSTTTPNATVYPTGTDAVYQALVDTFASSSFVLFGLTNEPGGNKLSNAAIAAAMSHAVGTIRAEEDKLGVPHHIVSVQGNGWTSDISFYATTPIAYDNVVYEVHGYPPATASYTYPSIPVILGEYGSLSDSTSFYADVESKQIPNLAWDFEPYSNCAPDLVQVTDSATTLTPTAWGTTVSNYLSKP
jgi:Cellulase (glycosyl hydrolase family 5)